MKNQIDILVKNILYDLTRPVPACRELALFYLAIKADGYTRAVTQRDILASWAKDINLASDDREYAKQQFDALPIFNNL